MNDFRRLEVWQRARWMIVEIYRLTDEFPEAERFGLTSQLRRAAVSVASNIAEGAGRSSPREFARLLDVAAGSAFEVETQLVVACDLGFASEESVDPLIEELHRIQRMLYKLIQRVRSQQA